MIKFPVLYKLGFFFTNTFEYLNNKWYNICSLKKRRKNDEKTCQNDMALVHWFL